MKLKTSKSASKRILRLTKNGKYIRRSSTSQHLAARKSKRTRKKSGKSLVARKTELRRLKKLLPNK